MPSSAAVSRARAWSRGVYRREASGNRVPNCPELGQVLSPQGGDGEQLDVVGNEHQVPRLPAGVDAAGGVGDHQGLAPQQAEHPHRVGDLLIGVPLVVVHPTLHHGHRLSLQEAEHQPPLVSGGGGGLEVGDVPVVHKNGALHLIPQVAQAGAQHHGDLGHEVPQPLPQEVGALPVLLHGEFHRALLYRLPPHRRQNWSSRPHAAPQAGQILAWRRAAMRSFSSAVFSLSSSARSSRAVICSPSSAWPR